mgnify:CR=1 FL=1
MDHPTHRVRLSFAGGIGEPPTLIDLTLEYDPALAVPVDGRELEAFIQWTLEQDTVPRETVDVPELNVLAPVLVYQRRLVRGPDDDKSCAICCEEFRPRKHVRYSVCPQMRSAITPSKLVGGRPTQPEPDPGHHSCVETQFGRRGRISRIR